MFLTQEQIAELTGRTMPSAQRRWLQRQGVPFRTRADGRAVVLVSDLQSQAAAPVPARPRFDAIRTAR
jgi:Domain of unknown function (DUF4224)